MDFAKTTEELWNSYFLGNLEGNLTKSDLFDPDCVIIGTGRHEFYQNATDFSRALAEEIEERKNIHFRFRDFWCEQKKLSSDAVFVYGGLFILGESSDKNVLINMDSRFTILYKKTENGWKIVHVHQSLPNPEQKDGEYYPKTLYEQFQKEKEKVEHLSMLAQRDGLTDLINYRTFEKLFKNTSKNGTWFFVADLDCFKTINDTCGHMEGNRILKKTATILKASVRSSDLVCRMGGDEFVLLCSGLHSQKEAESLLHRILTNINSLYIEKRGPVSLSVGGTSVHNNESLDIVFRRADQALYEVKAQGRNGWKIC